MDAFGIMGFTFGMTALVIGIQSQQQIKELKDELEEIKNNLKESTSSAIGEKD